MEKEGIGGGYPVLSRFYVRCFVGLVVIAILLTGCIGESGTSTNTISLSGTVFTANHVPVKDAIVSLLEKDTQHDQVSAQTASSDRIYRTEADGIFRFDGVTPGTYEIIVSREGYESIRITRTFNKSTSVPVNIRSFLEVVHYSDSLIWDNYQISAIVYQDDEATLEAVRIISPSGHMRDLVHEAPYGRERFNAWWNEKLFEEGKWELQIQDRFGQTYTHSFVIDNSQFPSRPELIYPIEWEEVDTASPDLEFVLPDDVDIVHFRVYDVIDRDAFFLEDTVDLQSRRALQVDTRTGRFSIPPGFLEGGQAYAWQIYVIRTGDVPLSYSGLSDLHYFSVKGESR